MSEELANYHFPKYPAEPLVKRAPRLDSEGIDLVSKFLLYEARKRISAKAAMHHSYFASLGTGVNNLLDGKKTFFYKSIDLDSKLLLYEARKRISAKAAMQYASLMLRFARHRSL